jgi:hypothetical protein
MTIPYSYYLILIISTLGGGYHGGVQCGAVV